jgi:hypothetical protein
MSSIARSTHWPPLCATDPTPGDDEIVRSAGRKFQGVADEIERQIAELGKIADGSSSLQGQYVATLQEACEAVKGDLGKIKRRYREVGGLLVGWAPELVDFQREAERLLDDAQAAKRGLDGLVTITVPYDQMTDEQKADAQQRQRRASELNGDLNEARRKVHDLQERRDRAAKRVADKIEEASADDLTDSWWDNVKDWFAAHKELIDGICKVLGVIALVALVVCLVVPGLNIAAGAALATAATYVGIGATSASLLLHTGQAATGTGTWLDVGLDAFSLATFGAGRFLSVGAREAAGAVRVEAATVAGERAAAPILAQAAAAVDDLAKARAAIPWWKIWQWGKAARLEDAMALVKQAGQTEAAAARVAAEEARLAEQVTIKVRNVLRYGDGDLAKIGMQLREDAKYLKGLTESVQLVDEAVGATGKAAAMFLTSGGTTVVSAGSSFYSPEWWNTMRETFVWEVGSLHRP